MNAPKIAIAFRAFAPRWLSDLLLAGIFLLVWLTPETFGWSNLEGLGLMMVLEVWIALTALVVLSGYGERFSWLPLLVLIPAMVVVLRSELGLWVLIIIGMRVSIELTRVVIDDSVVLLGYARALTIAVALIGTWALVATSSPPELGWTAQATPPDLWLASARSRGPADLPSGVPVWGFLYFAVVGVLHLTQVPERIEQRMRRARVMRRPRR